MKRIESVSPGLARGLEEQQKAKSNAAGANVGHDEVEHARPASLLLFVLEADQAIGGQRHDFPGDEEKESVVGD